MILTYFESKVNLFRVIHSSIHRAETIIRVVLARKNERSESFVPELLAHGTEGCQKKWLLHYGNSTILGSPELSRQVCSGEDCASWRLKSTFPPTAVDGEAILDDIVLPLWCLYGRNGIYCRFFLTFFRCSGTLYSNNFYTVIHTQYYSFSLKLHTITHYHTLSCTI